MAVFMVLAMLAVCVVPLADVQGSDAAVGDGQSYSYTIVYDSSKMATGTDSLSVDGMTAIYHPSYDPSSVTDEDDGTDGYGSWTWDLETGLGPFNSFYAAFDIDHNNNMVAKLNPFDLSKTIDGYDLPEGRFNIMWVLPTVYWKVGEITVEVPGENDTTETVTYPTLTLTNDATADGVAYAHTINGHVYKYVAYGVYEASRVQIDVGGTQVYAVASIPDIVVSANQSLNTYRANAARYEMSTELSSSENNPAYSMLWNYYQWQLYRYCCLSLMEDWNSQSIVGNGYLDRTNGNYVMPGTLDQSGPYAGTVGTPLSAENSSSAVKMFIENSWGSYWEYVDGITFDYQSIKGVDDATETVIDVYIQPVNLPTNSTNETDPYVEKITLSSGFKNKSVSDLTKVKSNPNMVKSDSTPDEDYLDPIVDTSGYPIDVITNDARLWGFPDLIGGSETTGVADYVTISTTVEPKSLRVGGGSTSSLANGGYVGLNEMTLNTSPTSTYNDRGTRLAFVFDADPSLNMVKVTFNNSPTGSGAIYNSNEDVVTSVDVMPESEVSIDGDEITIGYKTFTATPSSADAQYTYSFKDENGWSIKDGSQITKDTTITAYYDRVINSYTITWSYYDEEGQQTSDTTTVQYGKTPTHAKVPARDNYTFAGWDPKPVPVTGETTYTATYTPIDYRVTWDPTGGTVTPKYSTGNIETAITEYPTPTRDHYTFAGWYTQPENGDAIAESLTLTANVTYYAHWTADTYTVQFDAGDGSSASDETGSQMSPVTLPETTLADKTFAGWYTAATGGKLVGFDGTLYYPSADTTLYAVWSDSAIYTYSLNYNANGGYNAPSATLATQTEDGTYDLKIPNANVQRAGQYFLGWATTNSATEAEYQAGDIVPVEAGTPVTLYAVWSVEKPVGEFDWLFKAIAILTGVGVLIGAVALLMKTWTVKENMIKSIITITVASVIYICVMLPIFGLV